MTQTQTIVRLRSRANGPDYALSNMILLQFLEPRDHDLLELSSIDICLPPKIPFFNCLNFYYLSQAQVPILQQLLIDQVYSDLTAIKQTNKQTNKQKQRTEDVMC